MKVFIKDLSFKTIIGILPFERVKKQKVLVDISFSYKFDDSNKVFIDYSIVANMVKKTMKKKKFELIEEAIETLEEKLQTKFKLSSVELKITKPDILKDCIVSVSN